MAPDYWRLTLYTLYSGADLGVWIGAYYYRLPEGDRKRALLITALWLMMCQCAVSVLIPTGVVITVLRAIAAIALLFMAMQTLGQTYSGRGVSWKYLIRANMSLAFGAIDNYIVSSAMAGGNVLILVLTAVAEAGLIYSVSVYLTPLLKARRWFLYLSGLLMSETAGDLLVRLGHIHDILANLGVQLGCLIIVTLGAGLMRRKV